MSVRSVVKCNYFVTRSLRSRERGNVVHFSGFARKRTILSFFASEASA
ncbi:MAG: hypothetical protein U5L45_24205 [Saprospiraceae bacterium]|nr:hypothetical protein [Saprospiraceae bacterium]